MITQKPTFLTIKQVATRLNLPLSSVYDHAKANRFPGIVRIGRRVLINEQKFEAWIDQGGEPQGVHK